MAGPDARLHAGRRAAAPPRTVLLWVVALGLLAIGLYAAAPWLLWVRLVEGPLVQLAAEDGVTLVWFTSRPAECTVHVTVAGTERVLPAVAAGRRHEVRIGGLAAATAYPYRVYAGRRPLGDELRFQTNRPAGAAFTFLVFGDSGKGSRAQYALAEAMARAEPPADFLLHTGDVVYPDGARRRYEANFFAPYRALLPRVCFWPCLGNHDIDEAGRAPAYADVFTLPDNGPPGLPPEHNYWFDYATCRIAVVDSNPDEAVLRAAVAPWLRGVLGDCPQPWKLVVLHHPPYTGGAYAPTARVQQALVPVFEEAGVDLVLSGHDHMYQRTRPIRAGRVVPAGEGVVYVVSGAGGARLYEVRQPRPDYLAALANTVHSFTQITIAGETLTLRQRTATGAVLDEFTLVQRPPAAASAAPGP